MKGSCHCGAVEYEVDGLDTEIEHCHCATCRKVHAAAFNSSAGVARAHFRWIKGVDMLTSYRSSPDKQRHFCSGCGSHLMAERDGQAHVILRVATLDDDPQVVPEAHIWRAHDVPWLAYGGDMVMYEMGG